MKRYKVQASSMRATYRAGEFVANSPQEAIEMARQNYQNSSAGRTMKDVGSFWFYTVSSWSDSSDDSED